ncbi:GDP-mannose 4,6-dehydratase [Natronosporangium hydrolyticum]|uniref:GDP-mannose 4,6-dehydratase n=1 Tax=Natronosporangium hydrolyticum TaxID=2811111 RepID=A0A895YK90_9ACTN|nr:NAD-dependent epimerase/dehydratase family protein [Natronosporangium hydrolyticum]QSB16452.1 GDP-mannose 4,6-dehydratase [Natronosporangium hydrolyticum]
MSKVMVTGGAGFIGRYLTAALLARGDSVVVVDDFTTSDAARLAEFRHQPGLTLQEGSVLDQSLVEQVSAECDWTAHLAAAVGVRRILDRPLASLRGNVLGTEHVLAAAQRHHHQRVLLTSTSEVYGRNTGTLYEDADRLLGPTTVSRWSYSAGKTVDEFLAFGYWRELGLPVIVARLFNTVGPGQSSAYGAVLPRFAAQALAGEDLTVYGDGRQTRSFCYVTDVVAALLALTDQPAAVGVPVNVGSEEEVTILDLAHRVLRAAGSASSVRFVDFQAAHPDGFEEVPRRRPETSRVRELTGWRPRYDLDAIIEAVLEHERHRTGQLAQGGVSGHGE